MAGNMDVSIRVEELTAAYDRQPVLDDGGEDFEEYLIVTQWESREHQRAWIRSEGFRQAHSGPRADFILGHARFRGYDVQLASETRQTKTPI